MMEPQSRGLLLPAGQAQTRRGMSVTLSPSFEANSLPLEPFKHEINLRLGETSQGPEGFLNQRCSPSTCYGIPRATNPQETGESRCQRCATSSAVSTILVKSVTGSAAG